LVPAAFEYSREKILSNTTIQGDSDTVFIRKINWCIFPRGNRKIARTPRGELLVKAT